MQLMAVTKMAMMMPERYGFFVCLYSTRDTTAATGSTTTMGYSQMPMMLPPNQGTNSLGRWPLMRKKP